MRAKNKKTRLLIAALLSTFRLTAQDTSQAPLLTRDAYLEIIRVYHPLRRAADLDVTSARGNLLRVRGAFDPQASAGYRAKNLDGKEYYAYFSPAVTIPVWYGLDLKAGTEDARGYFLNPEITPGAVSYAGAKVVVNHVFFDARRAAVAQARIQIQQSEADRLLAINDLYYQSLSAYWNWWLAWEIHRTGQAAQAIAWRRMQLIRQEYQNGIRAAIDTVEAQTQVLSLETQTLAANLAVQNAGLSMSTYLWTEAGRPVDWEPEWLPVRPELKPIPPLSFFLTQLEAHPKLRSARAKIAALNLDLRLKNQYLLPKIAIGGSILTKGWGYNSKIFSGTHIADNYKLEVDMNLPLLLREARGNLQMARAKTQQATLAQDITFVDLEAKIRSYYNEALNLQQQELLWTESLQAYERLLQGEITRFENGESTLFLINARQSKVLEASLKKLDIYAKRGKAEAALYWATGLLIQ